MDVSQNPGELTKTPLDMINFNTQRNQSRFFDAYFFGNILTFQYLQDVRPLFPSADLKVTDGN